MRKYLFNFSVTIFIFKVVQQLRSKTEHINILYIDNYIIINQTKKLIKMTLPLLLLVLLIPNNIFS